VTRFVLDDSIVLTWCFPDEEARKAEEISERIALGDRPVVTSFRRHEVLNALLMGEKRKRLTSKLTRTFIQDLEQLPVDVDAPGSVTCVGQAWLDGIRRLLPDYRSHVPTP
jgi:predicted nucleic acid-binding protein